MTYSKLVTIFEGSDGSGKTTAALEYAKAIGARYVHCGPFKDVQDVSRLYAEAMLPALLGYQDVVLDRCWLSEMPYGLAYRHGKDRVGDANRRALTRLALRCSAVVVRCCPPWAVVRENFCSRRETEMLDDEAQLSQVYDAYASLPLDLPAVYYDYTRLPRISPLVLVLAERKSANLFRSHFRSHRLSAMTVGAYGAPIAIVGEGFTKTFNADGFYQWPFGSHGDAWLNRHLYEARVPEMCLAWINVDQSDEELRRFLLEQPRELIVALGLAAEKLFELGVPFVSMEKPPSWQPNYTDPYPLGAVLRRHLNMGKL